jgi:hypothetical protein
LSTNAAERRITSAAFGPYDISPLCCERNDLPPRADERIVCQDIYGLGAGSLHGEESSGKLRWFAHHERLRLYPQRSRRLRIFEACCPMRSCTKWPRTAVLRRETDVHSAVSSENNIVSDLKSDRGEVIGTRADFVRSQLMSGRAKRCKEKAAECQRQAVLVGEARLRAVYLELTQQWLEMAWQAEFFDRVCGELSS